MIPALRHLLGTLVPLGLALALGGSATLQGAPVVTTLAKPAVGDNARRTVGFTRLDPLVTGLAFTNVVAEGRYLTNQIYLNGSGVACGDVDGDGRPDVFLGGLSGGSALFHNLGGLRFTNFTAAAFPGGEPQRLDVTGCVFADLDGDGDLDLVLNTVGQGTWIFLNDGHGHFAATQTVNPGRAGMSIAVGDVDGDGDLDLYVANYRAVTVRDDPSANFQGNHDGGSARVTSYNGRPTSDPDLIGRFSYVGGTIRENGEPHILLLNDGHGRFTPVSWTDGAFLDEDGKPLQAAPYDWGLSCMLRDFTGDGKPDLYVCNDFESPDRVWVNETPPGGPVRFRAMRPVAMRSTPAFSMGVDVGDINRDGHDDLIALDMLSRSHALRNVQVAGLPPNHSEPGVFNDRVQSSRNMLQLGRGDGTFAEVGRLTGLAASEWSWTPIFLDVDLDGWEDVLISNGHELGMMDTDIIDRVSGERMKRRIPPKERIEMRRLFSRNNAPNAAFHNNRNLTFTEVGKEWGFDLAEVSLGMALVDLVGREPVLADRVPRREPPHEWRARLDVGDL